VNNVAGGDSGGGDDRACAMWVENKQPHQSVLSTFFCSGFLRAALAGIVAALTLLGSVGCSRCRALAGGFYQLPLAEGDFPRSVYQRHAGDGAGRVLSDWLET
jgi:hypothetical protein